MDSGSTENLAEGHVTSKRKRKCKHMKKARIEAEVQSMSNGISISNLNLSDEKKFGLLSGRETFSHRRSMYPSYEFYGCTEWRV